MHKFKGIDSFHSKSFFLNLSLFLSWSFDLFRPKSSYNTIVEGMIHHKFIEKINEHVREEHLTGWFGSILCTRIALHGFIDIVLMQPLNWKA